MKSSKYKVVSNKYLNTMLRLIPYSLYLITFTLLLTPFTSFSQRFTATADTREVPLNYTFDITYSVENGSLERFVPPKFDGFDQLGAPAQSTNVSVVNGRVSKSISYTYTLQPRKQGEFTIAAAAAIISGNEMRSNTVYIKVVAPAKQPQQSNDPFDAFQQQTQPQNQKEQTDAGNYINQNVFLRVIPTTTSVYVGEQLTLSYKLYFGVNIEQLIPDKMPAYDGFLSEEYKLDENRKPVVEKYNGKDYHMQEITRVTLFPTRSGNFTIPALEFSGIADLMVYVQMGFFQVPDYRQFEFKSKSNTVNINVKPLPEKNKPATFSGAVGKFSFNAKYDKTKVKVGEPVSLKVVYTGTGNLKSITPPKLQFPEEFEAYEPKIKDDYANNGSVVSGSKSFEYILVPQDGGKYKLPKYEFAYFDIEKGDYIKYTLPETEIDVEGEAKISQNVINFFKREKQNTSKGIYGIRQQYVSVNNFAGSAGFWTFTALPVVLLLFGFIFRKRDYTEGELLSLRRKKANRIALRRMTTAKKLLQQNNEQGFYNEVIRALWEYLSDKLYIPQSELSKENMAEKLSLKNIPQEKIEELKHTLDTCEQSLFSQVGKKDSMQQTYSKAIELIIDFEEQIKS
ncbi:MAG: hypothetical protein JWN78_1367 [Bacteroidota bacterium]|nr:hypothetical protein [Bacteroidota bacterium]